MTHESAHLAAMALPSHNKLLVLIVTDFDVKPSLSNKNEQKLKKLVSESAAWIAFTQIAFTQQVVSLVVADLDVKASIKASLSLLELARWTSALCDLQLK